MKQKSIGLLILAVLLSFQDASVAAHPLGQLSVNHYVKLTMISSPTRGVEVRYVVDLAELPTFREAQLADTDANGEVSSSEMEAYLDSVTGDYLQGLVLTADGRPIGLTVTKRQGEILPGQTGSAAMGLATMRLVFDLQAAFNWADDPHQVQIENRNFSEKPGWREMVVAAGEGLTVYDSSIPGNGLTDELRAYPESLLTTPLDERFGEWRVKAGRLPAGARPLTLRDGQPTSPSPDRFLALITVPQLTPLVIITGLLIAFGLGAVHALSPGHGKALVGAYLVGARGTARHAVLLGLTVTIAHTLTVYLGGVAFLFASKYILPERLYPVLSFISGAMIMVIGAGLLLRRLKWSRALMSHRLQHLLHDHEHDHHSPDHPHVIDGEEKLSTRNLLKLGISGGIIPCPSAWILMLGAISLNRTAYGLVLILAFSIGLAAILTVIGLLFVQGGRLLERIPQSGGLLRLLPVLSAAIITFIGGVIAWQALRDAGLDPGYLWTVEIEEQRSASALAILGLGLVIGLRHALDTDHLAAVSAIVSERRSLFSSLLIGGLWGLGHTLSLFVVGVGVIMLNLQIQRYEKALEFGVALMLIGLGLNVLYQLFRQRPFHLHPHRHGERVHIHPHEHPEAIGKKSTGLNFRPLLIGMVHGLAGSAGLMLGVLATISTAPLAFAYILIFGFGSIGGMMVMSVILGLPAHLTTSSFTWTNLAVRAASGLFSLGFGAWLVYEIGFVEGLLR
jgi:ABC-type nickel/cobalt efflux system permease component RcnA